MTARPFAESSRGPSEVVALRFVCLFVLFVVTLSLAACAKASVQNQGVIDVCGQWVSQSTTSQNQAGEVCPLKDLSNGLYGCIDENGVWAVKPTFQMIGSYSENGLAYAYDRDTGYVGYIDKTGEWVIEPQFTDAYGFESDGTAWVQSGSNQALSKIDEHGNVVVPTELQSVGFPSDNGLRSARKQKGGPVGYVRDNDAAWVLDPVYGDATNFNSGRAVASDEKGLWGVIDEAGSWIVKPQFVDYGGDPALYYDGGSLIPMKDAKSGLYGYIDLSGSWAIEPSYYWAGPFDKHDVAIVNDGLYGLIDLTGEWVCEPAFVEYERFSNGAALVCELVGTEYLWGYIDESGKLAIEPAYTEATSFTSSGYAYACLSK